MKSRDLQPDICEAKISFEIEGQIKSSPGKKKLKEFIIIKPLLYETLKVLLNKKRKIKTMNIKITRNTCLSTIESKKQSKQEQRQNHGYREGQMGGCVGEWVKR